MEDGPSVYTPDFFQAWESFAKQILLVFQAAPADEATRPLAAIQTRYVMANMTVAKLLRDVGEKDVANEFHLMAEALQDLVDGIPHPMFKVERSAGSPGRRGRIDNTSAIWRIQASVCLGIQTLIVGGLPKDDAIDLVCRLHRNKLKKLLRPNAEMRSSVANWVKAFASDTVSNEVALDSYKEGLKFLEHFAGAFPRDHIQNSGRAMVASAADRAALLP